MVFSQHTKISELIKANGASIEAIAGLAKPLLKLKNPLLRRVMASRVTVAEAAAIGGCSLLDFRRVLEPLGFTFEEEGAEGGPATDDKLQRPDWLMRTADGRTDYFDVRGIITSGGDPLKAILVRYGALQSGRLLCIINSFIPYPLIQLLGKKGAQHFIETGKGDLFYTWFFKGGTGNDAENTPVSGNVVMHDADSFGQLMAVHSESRLRCIDVRQLPMPLPMQTILETLSTLAADEVLYVRHKRVPLHLLEALDGQRYAAHIHETGEGDVRMIILQKSDG